MASYHYKYRDIDREIDIDRDREIDMDIDKRNCNSGGWPLPLLGCTQSLNCSRRLEIPSGYGASEIHTKPEM